MARANLGALLGNVEDPGTPEQSAAPAEPEVEVAVEAPQLEPHRVSKPAAPRPTAKVRTEATAVADPPYLRFVRKETRLREDQQNRLTLEARRLNRAKAVGAVRITDNTLIRVAVDLLLARISNAYGDDEAALLESLNR